MTGKQAPAQRLFDNRSTQRVPPVAAQNGRFRAARVGKRHGGRHTNYRGLEV